MKKIVKYLVAAVAMVAAVSCQEELALNERPAQNSGMPVFTASLNNLNTRTVLEEESMKTLWTGGEWINVMDFEGVNNTYSTPSLEEPAQKVNFSLKEGGQFYGKSVFAVYPHNVINEFWSDQDVFGLIVNHPTVQEAAVGTFDTFGAVHIAYNEDFEANNNLEFKNISALIKFTVTDPGVKKLTFYGVDGEIVSGPIKYRYDNGTYVAEDLTAGYDYVELNAPDGQYLEMGQNYYIAVAPGTFENGVVVEVNRHLEDNALVYKYEGKVVLNPNTINNFGSFETRGDLSWELIGDFNEWKSGEYFTREGDLFVVEGVKFDAPLGGFKIRWFDENDVDDDQNNGWNNDANYGLTFKNIVEAGGAYDLANGGWAHDALIRPGTYDIWFDPFGMKLYVMEPGVEPAEAEAIAPTRYVTGTLNGWAAAPASEYKMTWDEEWLTAFVEFPEGETPEFKTNVGDWKANWGVKLNEGETYEYESGELFYTANEGSNVKLPEPGFYMIQQSWDGYSMVVTDVVAPARGSQIYIPEADAILDLGTYAEGKLSIVLATDYPEFTVYDDQILGSYDYKILPDSPTSGKIAYAGGGGYEADGYTYIEYYFDNDGVMYVGGDLGIEDYTEVEVWTKDDILVFKERPAAFLEGMWAGSTSTGGMVLLDMTEEGKLSYSYLAKDATGKDCWIYLVTPQAYTSEKYPFATVLMVGETEIMDLFVKSEEAMSLTYYAVNGSVEENIIISRVESLKDKELPENFYETPDFKQWSYNWVAMGMGDMPAVLDFSVTMPGTCVVAYDPAIMGAPEGTPYQIFNAIQYTFAPADDESGKLTLLSTNMYGEILSQEFEYSDYTGETCYFAFGEESFVAQDVNATLVNVTVDANGGIAQ